MKTVLAASASVLALYATHANSQTTSAQPRGSGSSAEELSEVIVTGTRTTGLKAVDSAAPIQVVDAQVLRRVAQPDLISSLAQNVPSLTQQALGGDTANLTLSARLRGLSPNDTLVLINGKRRHGTANLAVLGGPYQGGAAPDLNFIPVNAIDHVEVLTDGAAAQYGTDAIAGVVNIITKKKTSGGNITASGGTYYDEGGDTANLSANIGFAPVANSWFNATVESTFHGHSNRGNPDPRIYDHDGIQNVSDGGPNANALNFPGYPFNNRIHGDAMYHLNVAAFDAGYKFANGFEAYSFGTYGHKNGQAFENYRVPGRIPTIYPNGFNPKEEILEDDFGLTAGLRGVVLGWNFDVSSTYGKDIAEVYTEGTGVVELAAAGINQTLFYDGKYVASQFTQNIDISRDFDVHLAGPLTVAAGVEERHDTYGIGAGEPNSYFGSGAQSFPGINPGAAGTHSRDNTGVYVNLALSPITGLKLDAAGRFEHYTDFGDTSVGKLTGRYDFTPQIAARGTISSGFRAPTLAEEYYSALNVGPQTAFGQFPPNSPGAAALGINGLKPETSINYSGGFVLHPLPKLTATLDAYYIRIANRIVGSGQVYGGGNPLGPDYDSANVAAALAGAGYTFDGGVTQSGINIFANGLATRTVGAEFVVTYYTTLGDMGRIDWSASGSYNETTAVSIKDSPPQIAPQTLYDKTAISNLEDASPKYRAIFGALWTYGALAVNLRESLFGDSSRFDLGDDGVYYKTEIDPTFITDLEVAYTFHGDIRVAIGANNLFNLYPDKQNADLVASYRMANDNAAVTKYPDFSPFGINGGYYYGRVTYNF